MSARKRPLAELPPNIRVPTPSSSRYAPSTPHAIRALQQRHQQQLQQRSAGKTITRSAAARRASSRNDIVRPDSARAILRRLAKITAPTTRRLTRTPAAEDKENERPYDENHSFKKPRMAFDIEESLEDSSILAGEEAALPQYYQEDDDDEDSGLPPPPTPSVMPDDDDEPTNTFRLINTATASRSRQSVNETMRSKSRVSLFSHHEQNDDDNDNGNEADDLTILTERGRRAVTEEPTGRLSRYSFGSLHMADIWMEMDRREEDGVKARLSEGRSLLDRDVASEPVVLPDDETQDLRHLRQLSSAEPEIPDFGGMPGADGDTFQLDIPQDEDAEISAHQTRQETAVPRLLHTSVEDEPGLFFEEEIDSAKPSEPAEAEAETDRQLTELESAELIASTTRRRKRVKMTKNGHMVPSLPVGLIKHIASEVQIRNGRRKPRLGKDQVAALEQATEWFFEQVGEDLAAYAQHSRRKKQIDEADVLMLMRRQRVLKQAGHLRALAKDWLPNKVLDQLDL
ncbi:hypothetical protein DV738_g5146, partial [Chaetothyriales sp. CBS 135597]